MSIGAGHESIEVVTWEDAPAILITDVWFSYDGHPVLEDVNFSIPQGDFVSIVGPNGGGKTTLLKLILGLLQTFPWQGPSIRIKP